MTTATSFEIHVSDEVLDDLRRRLDCYRGPRELPGDGWTYGVDPSYLRELVAYWADGYDWRAHERAMNQLEHRIVTLQDVPVHFMHVRGRGTNTIPLLLTHGWPWTFWDFKSVIGPLTDPAAHGGDPGDAFDVVVPSLPGFGFSSPLPRRGVNWLTTADIWVALMRDVLGYDRFAAHGGDWGALITAQLGHRFAQHLIGIHLTSITALTLWNGVRPWDPFEGRRLAADASAQAALADWERSFAYHVPVHMLAATTLGAALEDSPAGLLGWLLAPRRSWGDCAGDVERRFSKDDLLTTATIYWATRTITSSLRFYAEAGLHPWRASHDRTPVIEAPAGLSFFTDTSGIPPRAWLDANFAVSFMNVHDEGGHFAPAEVPDAVVADIRATFRPLRTGGDHSP
jgi:pimeloyl-ACP methyl ester carboxylesterase